jgi:hypothetical protein
MTEITAVKLIIKACVREECIKRRDMTSEGKPIYGEKSHDSAATLIIVEQDIEKKIERLLGGESIYTILPELEDENVYDGNL